MKKVFTLVFALVILSSASTVSAQQLKFGHVNFQELLQLMPELDSARKALTLHQEDLEETLMGMRNEYMAKQNTYQQKVSTWTQTVREAKEKEIQDIYERMNQFQYTAQQELEQLQVTLFTPVQQKAVLAVQKVGQDNGFIYIYDVSSIVYINEKLSVDIMPLAKKELGIPADKVMPTQMR